MRFLRAVGAWLARGYWLVAAPPVREDVREVTAFHGGRHISENSWTWYPSQEFIKGLDRHQRRAQGHL